LSDEIINWQRGGPGAAAIYLLKDWLAIRVITPNAIEQTLPKAQASISYAVKANNEMNFLNNQRNRLVYFY